MIIEQNEPEITLHCPESVHEKNIEQRTPYLGPRMKSLNDAF